MSLRRVFVCGLRVLGSRFVVTFLVMLSSSVVRLRGILVVLSSLLVCVFWHKLDTFLAI